MNKPKIAKLQAASLVFLMITSGLMVLINVDNSYVATGEDIDEDQWHDTTWIVTEDTTILEGATVYVDDQGGSGPPDDFDPHTGVVLSGNAPQNPVTLTVQGTLIIDQGNLYVGGRSSPFMMPIFGELIVDGGTVIFDTGGNSRYGIYAEGAITLNEATVQNNGTGSGDDDDTYSFSANASVTMVDSFVEDLAESRIFSLEPPTPFVYMGGIFLNYPAQLEETVPSYTFDNSTINNSEVGLSFKNLPYNVGTFHGIAIDNTSLHFNFTGSAPILINFSSDDDWTVRIQDDLRENENHDDLALNASHPILVNGGDVDEDNVDLYYGTPGSDGEPPEPTIPVNTKSTFNVSAMVNILVKDQAGNLISGADIIVNESRYDLSDGPTHGDYLGPGTVFTGVTDDAGEVLDVAVPLYSIYGHTGFTPPSTLSLDMYTQSHGDWDTTAQYAGEEETATNDTGTNPIDHDTEWIEVILSLKPDFEVRPIGVDTDPTVAGDIIELRGLIENDGSMDANCNITFYVIEFYNGSNLDDAEVIDVFEDIHIKAGGDFRTTSNRTVEWNTSRDMGDTTYTIIVTVVDLSSYEEKFINNLRTRNITLERPTPIMDIDVSFENDAPIDGDVFKIFANITNVGMAEADHIDISVWLGDPANGGTQIGVNKTFDNLDVDESFEINVTWNTFNLGNDVIYTNSHGQTYVTHDIYVWAQYNNIEDPDPFHTKNDTEMASIDLEKYYEVEFLPAQQFAYINEEDPYSIYAFVVKNTGRAADSFEFDVEDWSNNATNKQYWSYDIYNDSVGNLESGVIFLYPGESAIVYINITAEWNNINQGEYYVVYVNATSMNDTAKKMMVVGTTSAGKVDYTPTEIIFRREDGVRANNDGTGPDSVLKSLVANETSTLTVQIKNEGTAGSVFTFNVTFFVDVDGSPIPIGSTTFSNYIQAGFFGQASIQYMFTDPGLKQLYVLVDSEYAIGEGDETNNWLNDTYVYVKNESAAFDYTISGIVFDWDGQTPLPGASIRLRNEVSGYIDETFSDSKGRYTLVLPKQFYNDNDPIYIRASHSPDPAEDSVTLYFYSEDLVITNVDLYLYVFGVDLTYFPRLDYNISFVREDGKYTNQPIVGEETIIRFWIVNRGTEGTNGTYQITVNGTSTVNLIGDPASTFDWYGAQSITMVEYVHEFTDPEIVDFDINIVDADDLEEFNINNMARRKDVQIKSRLTNAPYQLTGTVYERASGSGNVFAADADVTITNTRTNYSYSTTTDDFGEFSYNIKNLPEGYEEGDLIHVVASKEDKEGEKTFHAYSEDGGIEIVIIFATYDVRVVASDTRKNVAPGEPTTYEIIIFNNGNLDDTFQLTLDGDYMHWGELEVPEIYIESDSSDIVLLLVDVPSSYTEATAGLEALIIVIATSNNGQGPSDSIDTTTVIDQMYEIEIEVDSTTGNALPGETVVYQITVTNLGNGIDSVLLHLTGTHSSWGELKKSVLRLFRTGMGGSSQTVTLTVAIPDSAIAGDDANFSVAALSQGGDSEVTPYIVTYVDEYFGVRLSVTSPTQYGDPGATIFYQINVENLGNSEQLIKFTITGDAAGTIAMEPTISGRSSYVVTLEVVIPAQAKANVVYNNQITATINGTTVTSNPVSINTVVNEKFEAPVLSAVGQTVQSIKPSTSVRFTLTVTNGANTDDTFSFSVNNSNPDFFYAVPSIAISSDTSGTVNFVVTAPANAVFNDIAVMQVEAVSSKGLISNVISLTVNVTDYIYGVELDIAGTEKERKINLGESVSHTITIINTGDFKNFSSQISLEVTSVDPVEADWIIDIPSTIFLAKGKETVETSIFVRVPSTTNTRSSISFNIKANVNLPKNVQGAENDPQYFDEIVGIVTIVNQPPQVEILPPDGPSYPEYFYKEDLEFDAFTLDPDGDTEALSYLWDFGDGSSSPEQNTAKKPVHSYAFPGTYQVSLTVMDEFGENFEAIRTVKVGNKKPLVDAIRTTSGDTQFSKGPITLIVDATDEDVNSLDYTWYFGDGSVATISNEVTITHTYTRTGQITVTCIAFDEFGGFGSNSLTLTIKNNEPIPSFNVIYNGKTYSHDSAEAIKIDEGDEVFFDAHGSSDPDSIHGDKIVSYNWIFGDNNNGSGVQPSHIYKDKFEDGYEVSLTVIDSEGKQRTLKGAVLIKVYEEDEVVPIYVYMVIAILFAFVIFLGIMFVKTPKKFFGAMKKGTAQAELAALIEKLNTLEGKLQGGAVASTDSFAPSEQPKYCSHCGAGNEPDGKFCETCGLNMD